MDSVNKIEYKVRDLGTRSVTLFPTKAQVFRQIKDVALKPGANEITIVGLSPTVDEHSIKVDGTGAAIITDIHVESLPNRESYDDVYPSSDESEPEGDDEEVDPKQDETSREIKAIDARLSDVRSEIERAREESENASSRRDILAKWSDKLDDSKERPVVITDALDTYKMARNSIFLDEERARKRFEDLNNTYAKVLDERNRQEKRERKASAAARKALRKADKAKAKESARKARLAQERVQERSRVRKERENFWPKVVYTVRISLDANAYTPMSSRRGSVSSEVDLIKPSPPLKGPASEDASDGPPTCDLLLSYVTTSAYWSPSYDLQLSTTSATGTLCFDAQLRNSTSETWDNCRVTLSTTQSTFSGLEDTIPTLQPWHIKLATRSQHYSVGSDVLSSAEERSQRDKYKRQQHQGVQLPKPRSEMFGAPNREEQLQDYQMQLMLLEQQNKKRLMMARQEQDHVAPIQQPMQSRAPRGAQYGSAAPMPSAFVAPKAKKAARMQMSSTMMSLGGSSHTQSEEVGRSGARSSGGAGFLAADGSEDEDEDQLMNFDVGDDATIAPETSQAIAYQESLVEETGLTTTYDLPGLKTLAPKSTVSKQRVARINFPSVAFSHIVVAKYRPVAYLKAKLRNSSKLTLLKGPAGLTLDGSFMGRTTLPRCSAGDVFSLSLGVDPAIKAVYGKPDVRRSTTGVFNKENSSVYVRTLTLHNTRAAAGKPVSVLALDQVPVSEDERLRVAIIAPYHLAVGGEGVFTGRPGRDSREDVDWGRAKAVLKKGGEINWDIDLNAGKAVKLVLEYTVACPSGDVGVEC